MQSNILVILVDQWRASAFGHRGADIATPNIDRLAQQGTVYTNAFTSCPLCSPARAALLTGRWPHQTGLCDNHSVGYSQQESLSMDEVTWIDEAARSGYHVGYFGKWHLGPNNPETRGAHRFDPGVEGRARPYDRATSSYTYASMQAQYEREGRERLKRGRSPFWGEIEEAPDQVQPFPVMARGVGFLREWATGDRDQPFQLTLSSAPPHFPHYLPADYCALADSLEVDLPASIHDDLSDKPWFHATPWWPCMDTSVLSIDEWRKVIAFSRAHMTMVDEAIGRVLDEVERLGLTDTTTVVFTADHGDMDGAHGRFDKGPYFYEEVWRIPLIIRQPGAPPQTQDAFVSILDAGETCFGLMGSEPSPNRPRAGRNLLPLVGTPSPPRDWPREAHGIYDRYNGMSFAVRAIREDRWKFVWNPQDVDELYDLDADPYELTNLAGRAEFSCEADRLRDNLMTWLRDIDDPILQTAASLPPAGTILATGEMGP